MAGGNFSGRVIVVDTHGLEHELVATAKTFKHEMVSALNRFSGEAIDQMQKSAPKRGEFRRIGNIQGWSQLRLRRASYKPGNLARATMAEDAKWFATEGPKATSRLTVRKSAAPYAPFVILGTGPKTVPGPRKLRFPETRPWRGDRGRTWVFAVGHTLRGQSANDYMMRGLEKAVAAGRLAATEERLASYIENLKNV